MELHYNPDYFFDKMKWYEINYILNNYQYRMKNECELTRNVAYIIAQSNSTKRIKPTDIMQFDWDLQINKEADKKLSEKDIELYRKKAKEIIQKNFMFK